MKVDTPLLRQVHPSFIQNGRVSSQAFRPTPKDDKKLSVYDGHLIAALDAYEHYTTTLKQSSVGVMAVTCQECAQLELETKDDPLENFPEHAVIDFSPYGTSATEKKAKILRRRAEERDWFFSNTGT
ncbi:hypothetical protein MIH18_15420 [Marinobacter sp. M3C]|uniref:hypothetical protein n=1 Tax=unclassified Marinobacter TaxID=83889 RepID=UPI00200D4ECD|nr:MULTISPECIES: hypothetical protein [unclassified Marinobacter]MCL1478282.1 hypothetical protein [Marinobacter sp.]MCL1480239.1 hypothetical protein [Marinobacter sp.]MCL1483891.1 hypothetical protein [Marinobacter sp.]MCL1487259.1 hypothetical protein [Marinobacter sp.]UQG55554.1 hypothetical protein MIH16_19530 [Marinobacter sp. M4C]